MSDLRENNIFKLVMKICNLYEIHIFPLVMKWCIRLKRFLRLFVALIIGTFLLLNFSGTSWKIMRCTLHICSMSREL